MDPGTREELVGRIREAAEAAFGRGLRSLIVKGSVLSEDFIPGYSDLDVHVYVSPLFLRGKRAPELAPALDFQRALGSLDPAAYGLDSLQVIFVNAKEYPRDWQKPLPGTYELVYGEPVDDSMSVRDRVRTAASQLSALEEQANRLVERFVDKPDARLPRLVRLAGTFLKGALLNAALVATKDPERVAEASRADLLDLLPSHGLDTGPAVRFFAAVERWERLREDPAACRDAFQDAIQAMDAVTAWNERGRTPSAQSGRRKKREPRLGDNPRMGR